VSKRERENKRECRGNIQDLEEKRDVMFLAALGQHQRMAAAGEH